MSDELWQTLRYLLIASGMYIAGRFSVPTEVVGPFVDLILQATGSLFALGTAAWGIYVRWNTKAVLAAAAARVPTVSMGTGKVNPADDW